MPITPVLMPGPLVVVEQDLGRSGWCFTSCLFATLSSVRVFLWLACRTFEHLVPCRTYRAHLPRPQKPNHQGQQGPQPDQPQPGHQQQGVQQSSDGSGDNSTGGSEPADSNPPQQSEQQQVQGQAQEAAVAADADADVYAEPFDEQPSLPITWAAYDAGSPGSSGSFLLWLGGAGAGQVRNTCSGGASPEND